MKERIEKVGKGNLLETIHLEGAGHFIDAPYLPLCQQNINGGEPRLHATRSTRLGGRQSTGSEAN